LFTKRGEKFNIESGRYPLQQQNACSGKNRLLSGDVGEVVVCVTTAIYSTPGACMMKKTMWCGSLATMLALSVAGAVLAQTSEPIKPLPNEVRLDDKKVALGARLFGDVRFAKNNDVSCLSCHDFLRSGGADARQRPIGTGGAKHVINAPTVLNSDLNIAQLWDGGSQSLEAVVNRVVKAPLVFNSSWAEVLGKLSKDAALKAQFEASYKDGMNEKNAADALAIFQRSLITPSRFDRYLRGDGNAITTEERRGYEKFKTYGCVACHQGMGVGGNMFQQFGVLGNYFKDRGNLTKPDNGRFNVTGDPNDRHVFKVPSLRNVEYTAPYFHDGTAKTLNDAVDVMFKYQLGRSAPLEDKDLIVKFLKTLSADTKQLKEIDALVRGGK
jgi:cytochrome c peroxidase